MQHMTIFGRVAQSTSPYGRITPVNTPGAIAPSTERGGLSDGALGALGSMFDEWNTDDDTEFLAAEQSMQKELKDVESSYKAAGSWEKPYLRDYADKKQKDLKALRANPPKSSSFDRATDSFGDMFGITKSNEDQASINRNKSHNLFKNWFA